MKEIEKLAKSIADTLNSEFYTKVSIGIGKPVDNIKDLARAYKEAQVALEVGDDCKWFLELYRHHHCVERVSDDVLCIGDALEPTAHRVVYW